MLYKNQQVICLMKPVFYVPLPFYINIAQQCSYDSLVRNIENAMESFYVIVL